MKKLMMLALAAGFVAVNAQADIPNPKRPKVAPSVLTYTKDAAEDLWDSLDVTELREYSLRTSYSMVKILRAADGKFELACAQARSKVKGRGKVDAILSTKCTLKVSRDGKPVPKYRMRRIVG